MNILTRIRIPTFLALFIVLIGIGTGVFFSVQNQNVTSKASLDSAPKDVLLTNVRATSVTISWRTDDSTPGLIRFGQGSADEQTAFDDRDSGVATNRNLHYLTLKRLVPGTTYQYQIVSGKINTPINSFTTAAESEVKNSLKPIIGSVLDTNKPLEDGIVYLEIPGAVGQSALVKDLGNFIIPLNEMRRDDLTSVIALDNEQIKLTAVSSDGRKGTVSMSLQESQNPIAPIKLGQDVVPAELKPQTLGVSYSKFDLNKDGSVNTSDYAILMQNFGRSPKVKEADLNSDGVVDKKDQTLMSIEIKKSNKAN